MAEINAADLLRDFEGYRSTPYWDVNAWRLGYGSDTMTLPDGTVVPVAKDSSTTREDAERDLARRVPEFQQQGIIPYVGQAAWDRLPEAAKAAVTSTAYNYGSLAGLTSLTKAIKAGDTDKMASALEKYASHNGGVNKNRRLEEAAAVRGAPLPKVGMSSDPPIPASMTRGLDIERTKFATALNNTPLPRPRPLAPPSPPPASLVSTARSGATEQVARNVTPRFDGTTITDPRPSLDWGLFKPGVSAGGLGSLLSGGINPATPNPVKPPVQLARPLVTPTTLRPATRPDVPVGSMPAARPPTSAPGAGLTPAQQLAMLSVKGTSAAPQPSIIKTTGGIAGTVPMAPGARPSIVPLPAPKPLVPPAPLSAPGAGLTAAQRMAMTSLTGLGPTAAPPPLPVPRPPNLAAAIAPPTPIPRQAAPVQQPVSTIVNIGGYLYDSSQKTANGGLLKVGKAGSTSSNNSKSGSTSSGQSKTTSSGESWASAFGKG